VSWQDLNTRLGTLEYNGDMQMAKLRFANLDAEIDGDPKEIATILKELKGLSITSPPCQNQSAMPSNSILTDNVPPRDDLFKKIPNKYAVAKMLEDMGKPFSHALAEQQMRFLGTIINSREEPQIYSKFYDAFAFARKQIKQKYGGQWEKFDETVNGHQTTRYEWVESKEDDEQPPQTEKQIVETEGETSKERGSLFNF
jgi:hypothetical protein